MNYIHAYTMHYLISVLTLATSISYSFLTASLTMGLLARLSTMNTRVLLSSIFFMADSVVRGNLTMLYLSSLKSKGVMNEHWYTSNWSIWKHAQSFFLPKMRIHWCWSLDLFIMPTSCTYRPQGQTESDVNEVWVTREQTMFDVPPSKIGPSPSHYIPYILHVRNFWQK